MPRHLPALFLLVGLLAVGGSTAAQNAGPKRAVYEVKYGSAKNLAGALAEHFKDAADVKIVPEPESNCLLVSAAPAVLDEVIRLIGQLDRRPRSINLEVILLEVAAKRTEGGKPDQEIDALQLSGPAGDVLARVEELKKSGQVLDMKRVHLAAVDNQQSSVMVGGSRPHVTGVRSAPAGRGGGAGGDSSIIAYRELGTIVTVTPRIGPEGLILLDLMAEDSKTRSSEDGIQLGTNAQGAPVPATEFVTTKLTSKIQVTSGHAVRAEGIKTSSKGQQSHALIIAIAQIVEPGGKPGR